MSELTRLAKELFAYERSKMRLDGWFLAKEIECALEEKYKDCGEELKKAYLLQEVVKSIPLELSAYHVFAGTQDDAFARSYALINPSFKVEEFSGYCDPTAVFNDIEPNEEFSSTRIDSVREQVKQSAYVRDLSAVYEKIETYTQEVVFFVEQVTGHLIPDFRYALKHGLDNMIADLEGKSGNGYKAMKISLEAVILLADRYLALAKSMPETPQLKSMIATLENVPRRGATSLQGAIQMFILLWQVMCVEQTPNPFAFSVGNADRIFEPYRNGLSREETADLLKHFLVFFNESAVSSKCSYQRARY